MCVAAIDRGGWASEFRGHAGDGEASWANQHFGVLLGIYVREIDCIREANHAHGQVRELPGITSAEKFVIVAVSNRVSLFCHYAIWFRKTDILKRGHTDAMT
jgi:hypothetical protein